MITTWGHLHTERPRSPVSDQQVGNADVLDAHDDAAWRDDRADEKRYRLISIDAVDAPEGCTGADWFVYRIVQGMNGITGYRSGSLERVSADVESIVTALNGRRQWNLKRASKGQRRGAATARREAAT